jgi:hypothetical protein
MAVEPRERRPIGSPRERGAHRLRWVKLAAIAIGTVALLGGTGTRTLAANSGWIGSWWDPIDVKDYEEVWGLKPTHFGKDFWGPHFHENGQVRVQLIASSAVANLFWPGEQPELTLQFVNLTDQPLMAKGKLDLCQWGMRIGMENMWKQRVFRIADRGTTPLEVNLPAKGFQNVVVKPSLPEKFGAYALIVALEGQDRLLGAFLARTMKAKPERVQYPVMSLDESDPAGLERLGIKAVRMQIDFTPKSHPEYEKRMAWYKQKLDECHRHNVTVLAMPQGNGVPQPLGRGRGGHYDKDGRKGGVGDAAWLPECDEEFEDWVAWLAGTHGWPKGPINAFHLWNEPWEGGSVAGWGADCLRYREIYTAMCKGVERARRDAGVEVLVGGCDSSSNAHDKLFCDGSDQFLKWYEFLSIHYQAMDPSSMEKVWVNRKPRARFWDTESWIANSEGQVASTVAAMRSAGYDRVLGMMTNNIMYAKDVDIRTGKGQEKRSIVQAVSLAPALVACTQLLGERPFKELLFRNGLPWVTVFDGLPDANGKSDPEDGTVVVVGDIGAVFTGDWPDWMLFRTARSLKERSRQAELKAKLAALPTDAKPQEREAIEKALKAKLPLQGATLTVTASDRFRLIDPYGNPAAPKDGKYECPLNSEGYFLRGDGRKGSFEALLAALRQARMDGIEPLAKACSDMTAPVGQKPTSRLRLTNVLNRPVQGRFSVKLGKLQVEAPQDLTFGAHETKEIPVRVTGGEQSPSNTYPLSMVFDAGADGTSTHEEDMRCNVVARRTIRVDGKLDDWDGALPQIVNETGQSAPTMAEASWWPMRSFDASMKKGAATCYVASDDNHFYFAAKVADATPDPGMPRYATLDPDQFFYPEVVYAADEKKPAAPKTELVWPKGVRRFTYWTQMMELPSGTWPAHDNVQIAFQVFPRGHAKKDDYLCPPGTMPGYIGYHDSDYILALNPIAERYGGGTEIWRLKVPGMPRKHFYPRQPSSPRDGPVKNGKLAIAREGNTRIVECAIPWSEVPEVKAKRDAGEPVRFSFRINDNAGTACMELARERSVSRRNSATFRNDWEAHWANEVEFGWER